MVFKDIPRCTGAREHPPLHIHSWQEDANTEVLPAAYFSPLMIKIKRSRMLNIHHKSGLFAQKIQPSMFSTIPGSLLQNERMGGGTSLLLTIQDRKVKKKSSCKLPT